ncbi:MAG: sulfate/molybdate ABC transporter ATP-binding protein [Polyangiaceae bacterium]|nr:sulfate/molybdate ABC transporter ATP-binding protein [Polyangiaceae bacterium]
MISAQNLTKSFGPNLIVDDVTFEAADGEVLALLGPSGGGKSTVLRIVAGLEVPDKGTVVIRGADATNIKIQERGLGFVFQHYALFKHMTVRDNIAFGLEIKKVPKREIDGRVEELLELVQLKGLGPRYPAQLSGGQRQRVALARALAPKPSILLLDEPFGALDAKVRLELRSWLRSLQKSQGITCVFVTHDQEEAMELADRVVIIHRGKVEQIGTPEAVYDRPATPFVASFIGSSNILRGVVQRGKAELGASLSVEGSGASLQDGADVKAFIRHHQVEVVAIAEGPAPDGFSNARVRRVTRVGWVAKLDLELADGQSLVAELPKERLDELGISDGSDVRVSLRNATVFVEDYVI